MARRKLVLLCKRYGLKPRQSYEREGTGLGRRAGRYAHAKQFKRMRRVRRRQRTVLGRVIRDIGRKLKTVEDGARQPLQVWLEQAERIWRQRTKDKHKRYALHAPEVECIGKGKARKPYEFGEGRHCGDRQEGIDRGRVQLSGQSLRRRHAGRPARAGAHADAGRGRRTAGGDHGPGLLRSGGGGIQILHRGKTKSLTRWQWRWIKRRQAVKPVIGHLNQEHRLDRCWLKGTQGDACNALLSAAGYNLRWLMRWIAMLCAWLKAISCGQW